jgi:hypothetical protein
LYTFLISPMCYMLHLSHPPWLDHPYNNNGYTKLILKLLSKFTIITMYNEIQNDYKFDIRSLLQRYHINVT